MNKEHYLNTDFKGLYLAQWCVDLISTASLVLGIVIKVVPELKKNIHEGEKSMSKVLN